MALAIVRNLLYTKIPSNHKLLLLNSFSRCFDVKSSQTITRSLYFISRHRDSYNFTGMTTRSLLSNGYSCGCSLHTKGDKELSAFLSEEIENEMKAQPRSDLPKLEGFECHLDGAEVTLTKKLDGETITVRANVNNSVDAEESVMDPNDPKEPQDAEMKAKPEFTIEIEKGKKTLSFLCTYIQDIPEEEVGSQEYNDSFQISEISLFEGEMEDSTYTVSGDIMDGYLYDLLMNYLDERGLSNEFADRMMDFFTAYEHKLYVNLLRGMKSFVEK